MQHRLRLILFALLVMSAANGHAQKYFVPGYYVTLEDDTIKGVFDARNVANDGSSFRCKSNAGANELTYYPADIKAYVIANTLFFQTYTRPNDFNRDVAAFYKLVLKGEFPLLTYEGRYFTKSGTGLVRLTPVKVKIDPPKSDPRVRDANAQIYGSFYETDLSGQRWMRSNMRSCPALLKRIDSEYRNGQPHIMAMFESYYNCTHKRYVKVGKLKW